MIRLILVFGFLVILSLGFSYYVEIPQMFGFAFFGFSIITFYLIKILIEIKEAIKKHKEKQLLIEKQNKWLDQHTDDIKQVAKANRVTFEQAREIVRECYECPQF